MFFFISKLLVQIKSLEVFIFSSNGEGKMGLGGIRWRNEVFGVLLGHGIPIGVFIGIYVGSWYGNFMDFFFLWSFWVVVAYTQKYTLHSNRILT
jgi:hypothetical protein